TVRRPYVRTFSPYRRCIGLLSAACLSRYGALRDLHAFPTRRSSDLAWSEPEVIGPHARVLAAALAAAAPAGLRWQAVERPDLDRSEEHTSELQSRENHVCRLLLEKHKRRQRAYSGEGGDVPAQQSGA